LIELWVVPLLKNIIMDKARIGKGAKLKKAIVAKFD